MGYRLTADRLITQSQLRALLREMARERDAALERGVVDRFVVDYFMVSVAAAIGCRISELVALTWADVHDGYVVIACGKGGKKRAVVIGPRTKKLFEQYREVYDRSFGDPAGTRRLFIGKRGPLTRSGVHQRWLYWKHRLGLPKSITFHSLRHSAATGLLDAGVPLATVRDWLGHSSVSTTNAYLHLTVEGQEKLRAVL